VFTEYLLRNRQVYVGKRIFDSSGFKEEVEYMPQGKRGAREQVSLTARQMQIVEYITSHGKVTNRELQDLFKISVQAVLRELTRMAELKVIKPVGEGISLYYILV